MTLAQTLVLIGAVVIAVLLVSLIPLNRSLKRMKQRLAADPELAQTVRRYGGLRAAEASLLMRMTSTDKLDAARAALELGLLSEKVGRRKTAMIAYQAAVNSAVPDIAGAAQMGLDRLS